MDKQGVKDETQGEEQRKHSDTTKTQRDEGARHKDTMDSTHTEDTAQAHLVHAESGVVL